MSRALLARSLALVAVLVSIHPTMMGVLTVQ